VVTGVPGLLSLCCRRAGGGWSHAGCHRVSDAAAASEVSTDLSTVRLENLFCWPTSTVFVPATECPCLSATATFGPHADCGLAGVERWPGTLQPGYGKAPPHSAYFNLSLHDRCCIPGRSFPLLKCGDPRLQFPQELVHGGHLFS
jgi:hypothetical protein